MKYKYAVICFLLFASSVFAQIPRTLSYQGILTDASGNPKADGSYTISFSLYEQNSGGSAIWTESKSLTVTKGLFSTSLGDKTAIGPAIKFNKQYWLGISVGSDAELSPRIPLNSSAYSFSSVISDTANNIVNGKVIKSINGLKDNVTIKGAGGTTVTSTGNTITVTSTGTGGTGIQGIQNTDNAIDITNPTGPTATLNLKLPLILQDTLNYPDYLLSAITVGSGNGIRGVGESGIGVVGVATGSNTENYGVAGNTNSPIGFAVSGWNLANTGDAVGVIGRTNSNTGIGLLGQASGGIGVKGTSNTGIGVSGSSTTFQGVYGLSQQQAGVVGVSNGFDGVYGVSVTGSFAGVSGHNDNGGYGVWGGTTTGTSIYGISSTGIGVKGSTGGYYSVVGQNTNSGNVIGALGYHGQNGSVFPDLGVMGYSDNQNGVAILGWTAPNANSWAGLFLGPVHVTTDFYVSGSKNFKIDDPVDPANKFLVHSCIESPERMNVYNGNITTDANGDATVNLPSYFEALNIDYKYQLTVIGQFAQAIIGKEIQNNSFIIKTDKPNVKVSWQVTGVRNDVYAKANPLVVEQEKNAQEKGKYIFPELYGQPDSKGLMNQVNMKPPKVN